ncbi:MAG: hypothetical protein IPI49_18335 [Myxococcales bacterium]|nr:hypothetical protein [Myxococcales bacterium]
MTVDQRFRHCGQVTVSPNTEAAEGLPIAIASTSAREKRWLRSFLQWLPLIVWFIAIAGVMSALAITHWMALPHPDKRDNQLAAGLGELLADRPGWAAVHALYTDCQCSQRVVDHLVNSKRPDALREVVLLVGHDPDLQARLQKKGMQVVSVDAETLFQRFGIEGAPLFMFVDPKHAVRYVGGYTRRKQGPEIEDLAIMREIRGGSEVADLPLFGCAVSERLKELADPMALKR